MLIRNSNCLSYSLIIFLIINLTACQAPHFYRPRSLEPALLNHQKQLAINITGGELASFTVGYSPVSQLGIQAGVGERSGDNNGNDERYFNPYLSVGYYKKISSNAIAEIYGGTGIYKYKNSFDEPVKSINFSNYFLQPSIAYEHKNIDVAFTIRADYLKRNNTITSTSNPPNTSTLQYSFLKYSNYYFVQPGITIRGGIKTVKLTLQVSKSLPLSNKYKSIYGLDYNYNSGSGSEIVDNKIKMAFGIMVDLDDLFNPRQE